MTDPAPDPDAAKPSWSLRLAIIFAVISLLGAALMFGY